MQATLPEELAVMAKGGDGWALEELIRFHDRAIRMLGHTFRNVAQSMEPEDLRQEAVVAMIELLKPWKPGSGSSFATYFFTYAPHKIRRRMDGTDLVVRVPAYVGLEQRRVYRATGMATMPHGVSLYKPSLDGDAELLDEVEAVGSQVDYEKRDLVRHAMSLVDRLPKREKAVVVEVTLNERTMQEVADLWGTSRQYVHQTYGKALGRLREMAARVA